MKKLKHMAARSLAALENKELLAFLVALIVVLAIASPNFLTLSNLLFVIKRISIIAVIAAGMTLVIIIGEVDLSIGAIGAFASVMCAAMMRFGLAWPLAILVTLLLASFWGAFSGFIVSRYNLPAFLITMVMVVIIRTVSSMTRGAQSIEIRQEGFFFIGQGSVLFVPLSVLLIVVVYAVGIFVLDRTPFGRCVFAVGGNQNAAAMSGIRVERVKLMVLVVSAVMAALGGIIMSSKLRVGTLQIGTSWEIEVIAAVLIGGTKIGSGEGSLLSTLLGSLCIGIITSLQSYIGFPAFTQEFFKGALILIAIILNNRRRANTRHVIRTQ